MRAARWRPRSSYDALREAIVRGDIAPNARLVESDISTDVRRCRAARCERRSSGSSRRGSSCASRTEARACGRCRTTRRSRSSQARAVLEGLAVRQAAERIDDAGSRASAGVSRRASVSCSSAATSSAHRTRTPTSTRRCSSCPATTRPSVSSTPSTPRRVRYQYRTILIPGRSGRVRGGARGHRGGRRRRPRRRGRERHAAHLFNVAQAVRAGAAARRHRQREPRCPLDRKGARREPSEPRRRAGAAESPVELLRNAQAGPNVYPGVPPEFTNWRDEQQAWQETCVLFNQSYHMAELAVEGPDALKLLSHLAVNSFDGFARRPGQALRAVQARRLRHRRRDPLRARETPLQPRRPRAGAQLDHLPRGDRRLRRHASSSTSARALRTDGRRRSYRFQVQGPNAMQVIEKALGEPPPELKFFHMTTVTIAGKTVGALRHGMVGQPGWELFGPWDDGEAVREALADGRRGVRPATGGRAGVLVQHARVRLDPLAAAGRLLRREHEGLPRVAAGDRVRGHRVDRRQLRLRRHRGLLLHAVGPRLRELRQVRPRLHRARGARGDGRRRATARRSRWRSTTRT